MTTIKILNGNKEIYLIGTAHISKESVEEVRNFIENEKPDVVCVELCKQRYDALKNKERYKDTKITEIIKQKKFQLFLLNIILASFQKKLGKEIGVEPGAEMIETIKLAEKKNIKISLVDRDVRVTLKRAMQRMSVFEKYKFFVFLIYSLFFNEKINEEEIEKLKNEDMLSNIMKEMSIFFPSIKKVLIDERDYYIARKIFETQGKKILAVVGAGHITGIKKNLESFNPNESEEEMIKNLQYINKLEEIPEGKNLFKLTMYGVLFIILGLFAYGFFVKGVDTFLNMAWTWFLLHGIFSAIGAIIALAHPVTIIVSFISSPFTALHPGISVGMVAGLSEAKMRSPKVIDFENLSEIKFNLKGIKILWTNRVTKIFLVMFLTNLGGTIATFIAGASFIKILF